MLQASLPVTTRICTEKKPAETTSNLRQPDQRHKPTTNQN